MSINCCIILHRISVVAQEVKVVSALIWFCKQNRPLSPTDLSLNSVATTDTISELGQYVPFTIRLGVSSDHCPKISIVLNTSLGHYIHAQSWWWAAYNIKNQCMQKWHKYKKTSFEKKNSYNIVFALGCWKYDIMRFINISFATEKLIKMSKCHSLTRTF